MPDPLIHLNAELAGASMRGSLKEVTRLVESGADIHHRKDLPLRMASEQGHIKVVRYLVEQGADVHAEYNYALQLSALNGKYVVVNYLLYCGADARSDESLALKFAADKGHTRVVERLIQAGADLVFHPGISNKRRFFLIKKFARIAHNGHVAVMAMPEKHRISILKQIQPGFTTKQIRDEFNLMRALGLSDSQMWDIWKAKDRSSDTTPRPPIYSQEITP